MSECIAKKHLTWREVGSMSQPEGVACGGVLRGHLSTLLMPIEPVHREAQPRRRSWDECRRSQVGTDQKLISIRSGMLSAISFQSFTTLKCMI